MTLKKNRSANAAAFILAGRGAVGGQVQLIPPQILRLGRVGRSAEEPGEVRHHADVVVLGLGPELPDGHVLDHPLAQRADALSGHGGLLSEGMAP
jgi:hypothetical protein